VQVCDAGNEGAHLPQKPEVAVPEMPAGENAEAAQVIDQVKASRYCASELLIPTYNYC